MLPNSKTRTYEFFSAMLVAINCVCFLFYAYHTPASIYRSLFLSGAVASLLYVVLIIFKKRFSYLVPYLLLLLAILWLIGGNIIFTILLLASAAMAIFALRQQVIRIGQTGISYPSFPTTFYNWEAVDQVLLKDDILTIDLRNNQLFQFNLPQESIAAIDVEAFNAFCSAQIAAK